MPQLDLFEPAVFSTNDRRRPRSHLGARGGPGGATDEFVFLPLRASDRFPGLRAPLHFGRPGLVALILALGSIMILASAMGWYYWQSTRNPTWWAKAGQLPGDSTRRAEAVERGITAALYTQSVPAQLRTVELKAHDANSWLSDRMPMWLTNRGDQWPEGLSTPRIAFDEGRISVGVRILDSDDALAARRIVSLAFTPALEASGSLRLVRADARIGRARLGGLAAELAAMAGARLDPTGTPIEPLIEEAGGAMLREILLGQRPAMDPALVDLDDGRYVRILDIDVLEERVRVTYVTEVDSTDGRASAN